MSVAGPEIDVVAEAWAEALSVSFLDVMVDVLFALAVAVTMSAAARGA